LILRNSLFWTANVKIHFSLTYSYYCIVRYHSTSYNAFKKKNLNFRIFKLDPLAFVLYLALVTRVRQFIHIIDVYIILCVLVYYDMNIIRSNHVQTSPGGFK
jgi:ABC-type uncharacterized transport system permease subunit